MESGNTPLVTRIWEAVNKRNGVHLHTNDAEDNHMMAIIRNNQKDLFLPLLKEEEVYRISNMKLVPGPNLYRTVDAEHSINFFYKTKIEKQPDTGIIPHHKFELKEFEDVTSMVGNVKLFIDVIGLVKSYGRMETRSNGAQKMDIVLTNIRNAKMVVTLWEDKARNFLQSLSDVGKGAVSVAITGLLAKKISDAASLSSSDATRCYFNIDYAPLRNLMQAVQTAGGERNTPLSSPTAEQFVASDGNNVPELPITSILDLQIPPGANLARCICRGKIVAILTGNGWYYNCCSTCARTIREVDGKYYCVHCTEEMAYAAQRYRLVLRVEDASGTTTVTLFNKEAEQLVAIPVTKLLADQEQGHDQGIPPAINNVIGKFCVFQLKITPYNIKHGCEEYTVTRVSEVIADCASEDLSPALVTDQSTSRNPQKKPKLA